MTHVATITIDHTQVAADLTDFPVLIDLSDMPAAFWSTVANGGGDIRCFKSDGTTELPREVVSCDTGAETGELHVLYSGVLSSSTDTEIQIHADGSSSDYAVTDTYGRNAVWAAYASVHHGGSLVDSSGNIGNLTAWNSPGVTTGVTPWGGNAYEFDGTSQWLGGASPGSGKPRTISGWIRPDNDTAIHAVAGLFDTAQNNIDRGVLWLRGDIGASEFLYNKDVSNYSVADTSADYVANAWSFVAGSIDSASGTVAWINGGSKGTGSPLGSPILSPNSFAIGVSNDATRSQYADGEIAEVRMIAAALSDAWIATEYGNQSAPGVFYSAAAAGGGVSIACGTGSIVLTGTNATIQQFQTVEISCGTGSISVTGTNAAIQQGYNVEVACTTGSLTLTGVNASIAQTSNISLATGSLTLTGVNAQIEVNRNVTTAVGSITLTGVNAVVDQQAAGQTNIVCTTGSITVTGTAAVINKVLNLSLGTGSIDVTGINASISAQRSVSLATGSISINGVNATIQGATAISLSTGSISITGFDATISGSGVSIWTDIAPVSTTWTDIASVSTTWTEI